MRKEKGSKCEECNILYSAQTDTSKHTISGIAVIRSWNRSHVNCNDVFSTASSISLLTTYFIPFNTISSSSYMQATGASQTVLGHLTC